jgi:putative alpha-1,2-mannosidase
LRGGDLDVRAPRAARDAPYVQALRLDGRRRRRPWLRLADVAHGARLAFDLAKAPGASWGTAPALAPPSFGVDGGGCGVHRRGS